MNDVIENYLDYIQPTNYIVKSQNYSNHFKIPVLTAGKTFILGYSNDQTGIYHASKLNPIILFDDFTASFKWVDFDFKIKSSAAKILIPKNKHVNLRFFYHLMKSLHYTPNSHSRQWISKYSKLPIYVPSLKEQEKIVNILDKFTKLNRELNRELALQYKQYEYYKNELFTNLINVNFFKMSDLAVFSNIGVDKKSVENEKSIKLLNYMDIFKNKHIDKNIPKMIVTASSTKIESCDVKMGDVFITPSSEKIEEIGFSSIAKENIENCCYSYHIMRIRLKNENYLLSQFINYCFSHTIIKKQILRKARGITRYGLTKSDFENLKIPVPSHEEQKKIVNILDKFESLTSNLKIGLPKEIELINKQYEFYRNKLLSFKMAN